MAGHLMSTTAAMAEHERKDQRPDGYAGPAGERMDQRPDGPPPAPPPDPAAAPPQPVDQAMAAQAAADVLKEQEQRDRDVVRQAAPKPQVFLPRVATIVIYHPRPGEVIRGRKEVAAIVVARNEAQGTCDLLAFHDAQDWRDCERVPPWDGGAERGFEVVGAAGVIPADGSLGAYAQILDDARNDIASITGIVLGDFERPELPVLEMINALNERCDELEKKLAAVPVSAAPKAPRKPKAPRSRTDKALQASGGRMNATAAASAAKRTKLLTQEQAERVVKLEVRKRFGR